MPNSRCTSRPEVVKLVDCTCIKKWLGTLRMSSQAILCQLYPHQYRSSYESPHHTVAGWTQQLLAVKSHIHHSMETAHTQLTQLSLYKCTYSPRHSLKDAWNSALHLIIIWSITFFAALIQ